MSIPANRYPVAAGVGYQRRRIIDGKRFGFLGRGLRCRGQTQNTNADLENRGEKIPQAMFLIEVEHCTKQGLRLIQTVDSPSPIVGE